MHAAPATTELIRTYRVSRELQRDERVAFKQLKRELKFIGRKLDVHVMAGPAVRALDLITSSEAYGLQNAGLEKQPVAKKLEKLKEDAAVATLTEPLRLNLGSEIQVYEDGGEARLGVPIIGKSAVQWAQEREAIVESLFETGYQAEQLDAMDPYLTVAIMAGNRNTDAAGVLAAVAKDVLWPENGKQLTSSVMAYLPQVKSAQVRVR